MQDKLRHRKILLERILYICTAVYIATSLYAFCHNHTVRDMNTFGMTSVTALAPSTAPVAFKLLYFKPVYEIYTASMVLTYLAPLIGSDYHWYSYLGFDRVPHSSSDWSITALAVILYFYLRKANELPDKKDYHVFLALIDAVNIAVGKIWGFYEYAVLTLSNNDCASHYPQGIHDTIIGVLYAMVAGILLVSLTARYHKTGRGNFFTNVYEEFCERNVAGE